MESYKILGPDELDYYNKSQGLELKDDKDHMYVLRFLFNDKLNNAADPKPFEVTTSLLDKLAKKGIGMPWIIPPHLQNKPKHLKGDGDPKGLSAKALLDTQNKYSVGPMVRYFINKNSNNVYGIFSIWPDYQKAISENKSPFNPKEKLSEFTSVTLGNPVYEDAEKTKLKDAEFLNLQTVGFPGYPPQLASVQGVCTKGLSHCMEELKVLGSSGKLSDARKEDSFSNRFLGVIGAMSQDSTGDNSGSEPTNAEIIKAVEKVQAEVVEVKDMEKKIAEVVVEVATEAQGVDEKKIKEKLGDESTTDDEGDSESTETDSGNLGAAGKQILADQRKLKNEMKEIKSQLDTYKDRDAANATKLRQKNAETIVEKSFPKLTGDEKTKKIQYYVELADEDGNLRDIEILANHVKDLDPEILGSSGLNGYPDFDMGDSNSESRVGQHLLSRVSRGGRRN